MLRRLLDGVLIAVGAVLAAVLLLMAFTPQGRAAARTTLFVPQVLPSLPVEVQPWFTLDPVVSEVRFQTESGEAVADLYAPRGDARNGAVLFFQGVVPGGRFDARIVALADALARSGMVVMIPWLETQVREELVPEDIDRLVRGFQYLRSLDSVDPDRVGVGGICVGASFVTVAAQDDRIRDQVKFVNLLAGYYDITDLTRAIGKQIALRRRILGAVETGLPHLRDLQVPPDNWRQRCLRDRQVLAQVPRSGEADETKEEGAQRRGESGIPASEGDDAGGGGRADRAAFTADKGAIPQGFTQHQHRQALGAHPYHARQSRTRWCRRRSPDGWPMLCPSVGTSTTRSSPCSRRRYNYTWGRRITWGCSTLPRRR